MNMSTAKVTQWVLASSISLFAAAAFAQGPSNEPRLVLKGYDPVAYFTEQKAVKGTPEYRQEFDGARYHFASARNRSTFNADPDRYMPQFGGYCAMSVGMGKKYEGDPTAWKIIDGKLYVFGSAKGLAAAEKDSSVVARSRETWPTLK